VKQANFTAGCDPELFVEQDGEFFAAPQFVKGTKSEPEPLPSGGFVMYDNVAIEFGIPPAKSENEFVGSITTAIKELRDYLPDGFGIIAIPSAHFPEGQLMMDEWMIPFVHAVVISMLVIGMLKRIHVSSFSGWIMLMA
jgi:hypothetical protein